MRLHVGFAGAARPGPISPIRRHDGVAAFLPNRDVGSSGPARVASCPFAMRSPSLVARGVARQIDSANTAWLNTM